jgi:hypothetical protein
MLVAPWRTKKPGGAPRAKARFPGGALRDKGGAVLASTTPGVFVSLRSSDFAGNGDASAPIIGTGVIDEFAAGTAAVLR